MQQILIIQKMIMLSKQWINKYLFPKSNQNTEAASINMPRTIWRETWVRILMRGKVSPRPVDPYTTSGTARILSQLRIIQVSLDKILIKVCSKWKRSKKSIEWRIIQRVSVSLGWMKIVWSRYPRTMRSLNIRIKCWIIIMKTLKR